ncbi:MAG: hypothetical protein HRT45_17995 [Bdellovibrionales bacterium]|nr:hypothetical protein [Bdellovibrionales bacterium]
MNSLDDLLDQIGDAFGQLWSRIEESSAYNTLRENFEALPGSTQAIVKIGSIVLVVAVLFFLPISGILGSSSYIAEYEEKKGIIEGLIEAEQNKQKGSPLPPGMTTQSIQQRVRSVVQSERLIEGQGPKMSPLGEDAAGNLAPKAVKQASVNVNFFGLNLKQTMKIGAKLEALDASIKMIGMKIQPSKEFDEYYDASFQLVSFSLPELEPVATPGGSKAKDSKAKKTGSGRRGRSGRTRPSTNRRSRGRGK